MADSARLLQTQHLKLASQQFFNAMRVEMVHAMGAHLESVGSSLSVRDWTYVGRRGNCRENDEYFLAFDAMPPVTDRASMDSMTKHGVIGVYWFVNHADTRGTISRGQVYDLSYCLYLLEPRLVKSWPPDLFNIFSSLVEACVKESVGIRFADALPEEAAPPPPFQYLSQQPTAPLPPLKSTIDVLAALEKLRPAVSSLIPKQEAYNPANPAMPTSSLPARGR